MIKLAVQLVNNTATDQRSGHRISARIERSMRTYSSVRIEPHESYNLESFPSAPGYGAFSCEATRPDGSKSIKVGGWRGMGSLPAPLPSAASSRSGCDVGSRRSKTGSKSGGVGRISNSPCIESHSRDGQDNWIVAVEVRLTKKAPTSAKAISGHPLLRDAAVGASDTAVRTNCYPSCRQGYWHPDLTEP
jgi:hypothetical protein